MRMRSWSVTAVLVLVLFLAGGIAQAQDKYELNIQAYKGITFEHMFAYPTTVGTSGTVEETGLSLEAFVGRLSANLGQYQPQTAADVKLVKGAMDRLAELKAFLEQEACGPGKDSCVGDWPLRLFYEDDLKFKVLDGAEIQNAVGMLFREYFEPLEEYGLTLPWLHVSERMMNYEFLVLLYDTAFLERLGRLTCPDFFRITAADPLVDLEMGNLAQQAVRTGLLGAFPVYRDNCMAVLNADDLSGSVSPASASMCCNRATRTCQYTAYSGSNCAPCGSSCCLGSSWCP